MAFRIEKRAGAILSGLFLLVPAAFGQQEFRYTAVRPHVHLSRGSFRSRGVGTLTIGAAGVSYLETTLNGKAQKQPREFRWEYQDIQQLKMAPRSLTILTYEDSKWKLGADRSYEFELGGEETFAAAYQYLAGRLDQRFVAEVAGRLPAVLWSAPVKLVRGFGGEEGALQVGSDEIVYVPARNGEARTWRYRDIDNISSSGPFELTITTYERSRMDYGSRRQFTFQLKRRLEEAQYNDLWLRLNESHGLKVLRSYRGGGEDKQ
jgi:hypothetical protein